MRENRLSGLMRGGKQTVIGPRASQPVASRPLYTEELLLPIYAGGPQQPEEFRFLSRAGPDLWNRRHSVSAYFFTGIVEQPPQPRPGFLLVLFGARFGKDHAHGAHHGRFFRPFPRSCPIEPHHLVIP